MNNDDLSQLMPKVFAAIILFTAFLDAIVAFVFFKKANKKNENYLRTDGIVSRIVKEKQQNGNELIYPILKFQIAKNEYETKNSYGQYPWNIKEGMKVSIIFNSNNPNEAEIENKFIQYLLPYLLTAGSVLALIAAPVIYWLMVKK